MGLLMGMPDLEKSLVWPGTRVPMHAGRGSTVEGCDEQFGFAHIPNASGWWVNIDAPGEFQTYVRINSKGLRDRDYSYEKPSGVFRILVPGDSFADALERCWVSFRRALKRRTSRSTTPKTGIGT